MNHRRGISLTELLVVMSACGVVITLSSSLVCRVMRIEIESRSLNDVERNSMRLSEQFRHDVHRARTADAPGSAAEGGVFLLLHFADGRQAEYSRTKGTILRSVTGNGQIASREEFAFPSTSILDIREVASPRRVLLTMSTPTIEDSPDADQRLRAVVAKPVSLQVEAAVGRDLRFAAEASSTEVAP